MRSFFDKNLPSVDNWINEDYDFIKGEIRMEVLFNLCDIVSTIGVHRHSNCHILHSERLKVGIDKDRLWHIQSRLSVLRHRLDDIINS